MNAEQRQKMAEGAGFIAHVDVPPEVEAAHNSVEADRLEWDDRRL